MYPRLYYENSEHPERKRIMEEYSFRSVINEINTTRIIQENIENNIIIVRGPKNCFIALSFEFLEQFPPEYVIILGHTNRCLTKNTMTPILDKFGYFNNDSGLYQGFPYNYVVFEKNLIDSVIQDVKRCQKYLDNLNNRRQHVTVMYEK